MCKSEKAKAKHKAKHNTKDKHNAKAKRKGKGKDQGGLSNKYALKTDWNVRYISRKVYRGYVLFDLIFYQTGCCLVLQSCPTLHDPMDQSTPGPPVFHCLLEFGQIHVGHFDDTIQPSHPSRGGQR